MSSTLKHQDIEIPVNNLVVLKGWYLTSEEYSGSIIYFYGNGESVVHVSPVLYWLSNNFKMNVLSVDYRGYGFSEGYPALDAISTDVLYIYDYLTKELGQKDTPIFIYGRSLGTAFAIKVALQRSVNGVILEAPPTTITDVIKAWQNLLPWPIRWLIRLKPDVKLLDIHPQPVEEIQNLSVPLLVIHGTEDKLVPIELGKTMFDNAGSRQKKWCAVEGSGHNDLQIFKGLAFDCLQMFLTKSKSDYQ